MNLRIPVSQSQIPLLSSANPCTNHRALSALLCCTWLIVCLRLLPSSSHCPKFISMEFVKLNALQLPHDHTPVVMVQLPW